MTKWCSLTGVVNDPVNGVGGTVHNVYTAPFTVGPITITSPAQFTMNFGTGAIDELFAAPTILPLSQIQFNGALSANITSAVPEPTSFALIGIGLTGLLGYSWRRREVARRLADA
jgi:hypothetical protein